MTWQLFAWERWGRRWLDTTEDPKKFRRRFAKALALGGVEIVRRGLTDRERGAP